MWLHLTFLTIATILTWLWTATEALSFYTLQFIALLVLIYFLKNISGLKIENSKLKINRYIDAVILTMVVLLLIFSTGGTTSPLFFLAYFLLFGISFLFEPKLAITYSIILIIFFLANTSGESPQDYLKPFSLVLVSPLALFFGQQFLQSLADKKRIKIYQNKWLANENHLEKQETSTLFWLSLNFKESLTEIIEITANMLANISSLSPHQQDSLRKIKKKAETVLTEGEKLKVKVDQETDSAEAE